MELTNLFSLGGAQECIDGALFSGKKPAKARLVEGVAAIRRTGNGKWRFFPFWYTVLALTEIGTPEAKEELSYSKTNLMNSTKQNPESIISMRKSVIVNRLH